MLVDQEEASVRVVIIDVDSQQVPSEFGLSPDQLLEMNNFSDLPFIQWSPDGQKLLLGLAELVVLEIESGTTKTVSNFIMQLAFPDQSAWLPDSESVVYLDGYVLEDGILDPPQLLRKSFHEEDAEQLLSTEDLFDLGLEGSDQYGIRVSPTRTYIALFALNNGNDERMPLESTVLIFDLAQLQSHPSTSEAATQPIAQWKLPGMIFSVEWSPDEQQLAFFKLSETGATGATIEALSWSEGTSEILAEVNPPDDRGLMVFSGWNMVSWRP